MAPPKPGRTGKGARSEPSWFVPVALALLLAILLVGIRLLKEVRPLLPENGRPAPAPTVRPPSARPRADDRRPSRGPATVAIILDDVGWNAAVAERIAAIDQPLTLSILPCAPASGRIARRMVRSPHEMMLHLPMEPLPPARCLDKGLLTSGMDDAEFAARLDSDIAPLAPYVRGVNNHMGSRLTADERRMKLLMAEMKKRGLYFVDSTTSPLSRAYGTARETGVPAAKRDVFLDNSDDPEAIRGQLAALVETARREGAAVGIGHARPATVAVLKAELPKLESQGVRFVHASGIVDKRAP